MVIVRKAEAVSLLLRSYSRNAASSRDIVPLLKSAYDKLRSNHKDEQAKTDLDAVLKFIIAQSLPSNGQCAIRRFSDRIIAYVIEILVSCRMTVRLRGAMECLSTSLSVGTTRYIARVLPKIEWRKVQPAYVPSLRLCASVR